MAEKRSQSRSLKARKRQKTDDNRPSRSSSKSSLKATTKPASKSWKTVQADSLKWRKVEMPDRLDDVEGFFGLEEIDDVQIVNNNGILQFKTAGTAGSENEMDDTVDEIEGEEWTGFSDGEGQENGTVPEVAEQEQAQHPNDAEHVVASRKKEKEKEKKEKKEKKQKKQQKQKQKDQNISETSGSDATPKQEQTAITASDERVILPVNSFAGLEDIGDEDMDIDLPEWESLSLSSYTQRALETLRFTEPTPIQKLSIPLILSGHDLIGKAATGSGKTLAFGIPIFEHWLSTKQSRKAVGKLDGETKDLDGPKLQNPLTALILSPTRELAHQITEHIQDLISKSEVASPPKVVSLTGGLSIQKQLRKLTQDGGADVVVATPGRLWEILSEKSGYIQWFRKTHFLVFDEADRMLQEGHFKEVEEILDLLSRDATEDDVAKEPQSYGSVQTLKTSRSKDRQILVFSATFSKDLQQKLAGKQTWRNNANNGLLNDKESLDYLLKKLPFREEHPKWVDVNPVDQMAENLREGLVECGNMEKDLYLYYLLLRYPLRTLVFTNSISTVRRLVNLFQNLELSVNGLHSSMIQKARLRSLERFAAPSKPISKSGKPQHQILISTDVAARGLDIKGIELVIHYHVPRTADTYVHRSGRTARSKNAGASIILCSPDEASGIRRLIGKVHEDRGSKLQGAIKNIGVDRALVTSLRDRASLAQKIASSNLAKESQRKENDWLKAAAEDLGVDYESDEFADALDKGRRGSQKRKEARSISKGELGELKAKLKAELAKKVGRGSRLYLTSGADNLAQRLVDGKEHDVFFGEEGGWGLQHL